MIMAFKEVLFVHVYIGHGACCTNKGFSGCPSVTHALPADIDGWKNLEAQQT